MFKPRTFPNGLLLLMFLLWILSFAGRGLGARQCEVTHVDVAYYEYSANFIFNLTYKDTSCTKKERLRVTLESCGDVSDEYRFEAEDEYKMLNCKFTGKWRVSVFHIGGTAGTVSSKCFECEGIHMSPIFTLKLTTKMLDIKVQQVHPRLDDWNVTIYTQRDVRDKFSCHRYTDEEDIKEFLKDTGLWPQHSPEHISIEHDFDLKTCYCIVMRPISQLPLQRRFYAFSTKEGHPEPFIHQNASAQIDQPLVMSWKAVVLTVVLVVIVISLVVTFVVVIEKPLFIRKIFGLKGRSGQESPSTGTPVARGGEVLLLYAHDISSSKLLAELKMHLKASFKVYDIFEHSDHNQLADSNGWVEEIVMQGSGVKLLLVESEGLLAMIKSLLKLYPEKSSVVNVVQTSSQARNAESLLTFALRNIICSDLREDYSSVFVVRFSGEVEDVVDLLVQTRRYKFPDHFSELREAIVSHKHTDMSYK